MSFFLFAVTTPFVTFCFCFYSNFEFFYVRLHSFAILCLFSFSFSILLVPHCFTVQIFIVSITSHSNRLH
uniref:Uncharacterized protein n=1 Tax=Anopheles darlingi TaxID=43151 RepID=A0A2M4DB24_ANODA